MPHKAELGLMSRTLWLYSTPRGFTPKVPNKVRGYLRYLSPLSTCKSRLGLPKLAKRVL